MNLRFSPANYSGAEFTTGTGINTISRSKSILSILQPSTTFESILSTVNTNPTNLDYKSVFDLFDQNQNRNIDDAEAGLMKNFAQAKDIGAPNGGSDYSLLPSRENPFKNFLEFMKNLNVNTDPNRDLNSQVLIEQLYNIYAEIKDNFNYSKFGDGVDGLAVLFGSNGKMDTSKLDILQLFVVGGFPSLLIPSSMLPLPSKNEIERVANFFKRTRIHNLTGRIYDNAQNPNWPNRTILDFVETIKQAEEDIANRIWENANPTVILAKQLGDINPQFDQATVAGFYDVDSKAIYCQKFVGPNGEHELKSIHLDDLLKHEFGHSFAIVNSFERDQDFHSAYNEDLAVMNETDKHKLANYIVGSTPQGAQVTRSEAAAQIFSDLHNNKLEDISPYFPKTTNFIKRKIEQIELQATV